jgi:hypothetical protein
MMQHSKKTFYIQVTDIAVFNTLYAFVEDNNFVDQVTAMRREGYYVLTTDEAVLWRELLLYGQMIAQAQDAFIDAGEEK